MSIDERAKEDAWRALDQTQHEVVSTLASRQRGNPKVCFKGGTLLRLCWKADYRYSEDLDFDWLSPEHNKDSIYNFFDGALRQLSRTSTTSYELYWGANTLNIAWENEAHGGILRTDVKPRAHPSGEPSRRDWPLIDRYPHFASNAPILGYTLESMLAAKLDCLLAETRVASRDFYDLHHLLDDPTIDKAVAVDEFLTRNTKRSPGTTVIDLVTEMFDVFDPKSEKLADEWERLLSTGMISNAERWQFQDMALAVFDQLTAMEPQVGLE